MNNNLLEFVAIKDTDPRTIISQDSIKIKNSVSYPAFYQCTSDFRMMNGTVLSCRGNNINGSDYYKLFINQDTYMLDKPNNVPLFSFDIRARFVNQSISDHYFAHCGETTDEQTTTYATPYSAKAVIATSPSILQAMSDLGLVVVSGYSEAEILAIQNSLDYIYWKMRVKVGLNDYGTFCYYSREYFTDSPPKRLLSSLGTYILNNSSFSTAKAWLLTIFESVELA